MGRQISRAVGAPRPPSAGHAPGSPVRVFRARVVRRRAAGGAARDRLRLALAHGDSDHAHEHADGVCLHDHDHGTHGQECSHDHDHDHDAPSHGHSLHHEHTSTCCSSSLEYSDQDCGAEEGEGCGTRVMPPNERLLGVLRRVLRVTGLQGIGKWLEQSRVSSVAKISFFVAATVFSVYHSRATGLSAQSLATAKAASDVCTAMVYVFAGFPAAMSLLLDVVAMRIDTHVLMNLAVIGTLVAGLPLEGALLLVLFQTSHAVEHMLTDKAQGSLKTLFDSIPDHADIIELKEDGSPDMSTMRHAECTDVHVGDVVLVKPGCQVPLDGVIAHGQALVSAEHITGESVPVLKRQGNPVPAGSLCHDGALCVRVTQLAEESTPAKIAQLARNAQAKRPKLRTFLDVFGETYSKFVIGATIASFFVMVACGVPVVGDGVVKGALYRAMGLLTVASPCALVMVPMAYVSAIAALASRGILLKGGRVLDAARLCRTIAMDKTGTLTTGSLSVRHVVALNDDGTSSESLEATKSSMDIAKALSMRSSHPVSTAIIAEAAKRRSDDADVRVADFNLVPGGGVSGLLTLQSPGKDSKTFRASLGSLEFVSKHLPPAFVERIHAAVAAKGSIGSNGILSVLVVTSPSSGSVRSVSIFLCEDTLRDASLAAVQELHNGSWDTRARPPNPRNTCDVVMVTGDNEASANRIAEEVGIPANSVYAGLTPEGKLKVVRQLGEDTKRAAGNKANKSLVMMVGDGLNDAAALAAARVGIAIASPTMAASLASDVVVMNDALGVSTIPVLLRVSQLTHQIIVQNILLAAGSIAVLALPTVLGCIPLWLAVMFHEGSTLLVALNSLRILKFS